MNFFNKFLFIFFNFFFIFSLYYDIKLYRSYFQISEQKQKSEKLSNCLFLMNFFNHKNIIWLIYCEFFFIFISLFSTYDVWRNYSYFSMLFSVYSDHSNQVDMIWSVNTSWKSFSAANEISHVKLQSAIITEYKSFYD